MIVGGVGGSCGFARRMWTSRNDESFFFFQTTDFFLLFPLFFYIDISSYWVSSDSTY
jgi:hypothetical protein